jgi:hypothetical protein
MWALRRCSAHDEGATFGKVGADQKSGILPSALSFLDSFLSTNELLSLLPLSSWCCRQPSSSTPSSQCRRLLLQTRSGQHLQSLGKQPPSIQLRRVQSSDSFPQNSHCCHHCPVPQLLDPAHHRSKLLRLRTSADSQAMDSSSLATRDGLLHQWPLAGLDHGSILLVHILQGFGGRLKPLLPTRRSVCRSGLHL